MTLYFFQQLLGLYISPVVKLLGLCSNLVDWMDLREVPKSGNNKDLGQQVGEQEVMSGFVNHDICVSEEHLCEQPVGLLVTRKKDGILLRRFLLQLHVKRTMFILPHRRFINPYINTSVSPHAGCHLYCYWLQFVLWVHVKQTQTRSHRQRFSFKIPATNSIHLLLIVEKNVAFLQKKETEMKSTN